jgi:redox-regulated HSP33 family molecular chaperone
LPVAQKSVACKSCGRKFLVPVVGTSRQEISADIISEDARFALICRFCMTHSLYTTKDLE